MGRAAIYPNARGVFPSVTRVSAASLATGCYPASHGLVGNTMALRHHDGLACHSVGHPDFREKLRSATGRTLSKPTLFELLRSYGGGVAFSNVSPGGAYFLDPDCHGYVYHRAGAFGPGGRLPDASTLDMKEGGAGDEAMTQLFCRRIFSADSPTLAILWLSEPDSAEHQHALGSSAYLNALATADRCVRAVVEELEQRDPQAKAMLIVCSDHGMETVSEVVDIAAELVSAGLKQSESSNDVVVAPNGTAALIYVDQQHCNRVSHLIRFLRAEPWVDQVFTGEDLERLRLPSGTELVIAVALRSNRQPNQFGIPGQSVMARNPEDPSDYRGKGMHGGLGLGEQQPFLFIARGGVKSGARAQLVSLVDIAPTVLRHLGRPIPKMDGKPLQDEMTRSMLIETA